MLNATTCSVSAERIGILIAQLGTPAAPTKAALRPYLRQFLSDPRVIEANRLIWKFILYGVVLRTRPARSAALYKRIWSEAGSPLMVITKRQTEAIRTRLNRLDKRIEVVFGMRYGEPSLTSALDDLISRGCRKILLFNMYPQYSATTSASNYDVVFKRLLQERWVPTLRVVEPYYRHPAYIEALAAGINASIEKLSNPPEWLVLSYHGIPEAYILKGDPYCCHCTETTRALIPHLKLRGAKVVHTFQSRFGKDPWLEPYTDETITKLAKEGVKRIAVACPGFTTDCLETLDELGNEGRELFLEHGGESYDLIPCLNDHPEWITGMEAIIKDEIATWLSTSVSPDQCVRTCPRKVSGILN